MGDIPATLLLAVAGALWGAFNVLLSTQKQLNDMRNVMVIGKVGSDPVSLPFRRHMLHNDWIPAWLVVSLLSFAFGLMVLLAPLLALEEKRTGLLWFFCIVFSLVPFLATVAWVIGGYQDLQYIQMELVRAEKVAEQPPAEPVAADIKMGEKKSSRESMPDQ
jgi:hypothetical protein